ncbi:MAG: hypothetical protein JXR68_08285 [Bacteroidales bacterium]|nr:hypothetical protein [Bacteroidales bacterium]
MKKKFLLLGGLILFFASCSVKDSTQTLYINNNTSDTIIIEYNTKTDNGAKTLPFIFEDASNEPIVNLFYIYNSYYPDIDNLPLLTNDDLKQIISYLNIYKIFNGDTIKLDIDCYDINNWKLRESIDDQVKIHDYFLNLDENAD